ncbi:MAG TPA: hypothetical protein VGM75_38065 [Pseudonocardiaceae bacterium]|jgi:hypothetical protein
MGDRPAPVGTDPARDHPTRAELDRVVSVWLAKRVRTQPACRQPGGVGGCGDAAIAVDGKTAHGCRDADGPAVHLLGPELPSLAPAQN